MTECCSSHLWHHSDQPSRVREPGLAATFPALSNTHLLSHTHSQGSTLFYLRGCCLLSIWLGSHCLSPCPPHKPNNATLQRPAPALASRPVENKKEEANVMKRKGKSEEKRRSFTDKEAGTLKLEKSGLQDWRAAKASFCETRNSTAPTKSQFSEPVSTT